MVKIGFTLYCLMLALGDHVSTRLTQWRDTDDSERGSVTLEQVMVTLGLFTIAVIALGAIRIAVTGRLSSIAP